MIYSMYVAPEARGQGVGRALLSEVIARARALDGVEQVYLEVVASVPAARALYRSLNFEVYGRRARALKLDDGRYLDEELMVLWL
jgi:ribosomal protein S18 acetylase RimI-like enzyme